MKDNEIYLKTLYDGAHNWLARTLNVLEVKEYGKGSKRNYLQKLLDLVVFL
jgi:hypothetical protein